MKLQRWGRFLSVFLLLGVFFYATSVKELHYAFSTKYHSEVHDHQCDHHIHSTDKEEDCFICKMDVVGVFDLSESHYSFALVFLPKESLPKPAQILLPTQIQVYRLRGPPTMA